MKRALLLSVGLAALAPACLTPDVTVVPGGSQPDLNPPDVNPSYPDTPPLQPGSTPPAISGGTLIVAQDGFTAVAADPDRDAVYVVDLKSQRLVRTISLKAGSEPGRLAEGTSRRVHVALRASGSLVTINIDSGAIEATRPACGAPRGVAFDPAKNVVHVACATGELVTFPDKGGAAIRRLSFGPDLRDVVVKGDHLFVSRLKGAEVLELDASGKVLRSEAPPEFVGTGFDMKGEPITIHAPPTVAYRMVDMPSGGVAVVHTRGTTSAVNADEPGGYGAGPCKGGIVNATVSILDGTPRPPAGALSMTVLPVDVAVSKGGSKFAVVDASSLPGQGFPQTVMVGKFTDLAGECGFGSIIGTQQAQVTAVAFDGSDRVITQSREPAALFIGAGSSPSSSIKISLSNTSRKDAGHDLFYGATKALMACASCHPEGGEDGHVWNFEGTGPRRTQSIRGGILDTAPFHWSGDMDDLTALTTEVMTKRMMGPILVDAEVNALGDFLNSLPALPAPPVKDAEAVQRGAALFNDPSVGCFACHSGDKLTSNLNSNVGTGGSFQVPSLRGVVYRAPFLHTGCAPTLKDRFSATCGGGDSHGQTSQLGPSQIDDLVAFLSTL